MCSNFIICFIHRSYIYFIGCNKDCRVFRVRGWVWPDLDLRQCAVIVFRSEVRMISRSHTWFTASKEWPHTEKHGAGSQKIFCITTSEMVKGLFRHWCHGSNWYTMWSHLHIRGNLQEVEWGHYRYNRNKKRIKTWILEVHQKSLVARSTESYWTGMKEKMKSNLAMYQIYAIRMKFKKFWMCLNQIFLYNINTVTTCSTADSILARTILIRDSYLRHSSSSVIPWFYRQYMHRKTYFSGLKARQHLLYE